MQNLGEKAGTDGATGTSGAANAGNGVGDDVHSGGRATTFGELGATSGAGGFTRGGSGSASAVGGSTGVVQGGAGGSVVPQGTIGGGLGTFTGGECWGTLEETSPLSACPATYCEVRAQMVGYCGNYVQSRRPPIVEYAYQQLCSDVKDINISVATSGYACRYVRNTLVGILEYGDSAVYCAGRSPQVQAGVRLQNCSTNRLIFCDARSGSGGSGGALASSGVTGSSGMSAVGVAGRVGYSGNAGASANLGGASESGAQQYPIGLCYDAATDTCQPC